MAKTTKPGTAAKKSAPSDDKVLKETDTSTPEKSKASPSASQAAATSDKSAEPKGAKASQSKPDAKTTSAKPASKTAEKAESKPAAEPAKSAASAAASKPAATAKDAKPKDSATKPASDAVKATPDSKATPEKPEPKPAAAQPTPAAAPTPVQPAPKSSGFWPLVLGGVVAAVLGFVASEMNLLNSRENTADLEQAVTAQEARLAELESAEPAPVEVDLSGIETTLAAFEDTLSALEARLAELEARPVIVTDDGASASYAEELAKLESSVATQSAEIARLLENAQTVEEATASAARAAAAQTALAKITAAISDGSSYAAAMAELEASGVADLPPALGASADDGVAALQTLQSDFPDVARDALAAARAVGGDGGEAGLGGFLRRQLGARSVAPREGDDPDAVLSRAEAAVRGGDIPTALSEMEALPEVAQDATAAWRAQAAARADAQAAVEELSQRLTAN